MPRRYTEPYWVYEDMHGQLIVKYEDDWETIEEPISDMAEVLKLARTRSPDWVINIVDDMGNTVRRFTPKRCLQLVKDNPHAQPLDSDIEHYRFFHGVPPDKSIDMDIWVPGEMVLVGKGEDVGYGIMNKHSNKDGWYVHDFGPDVKVYRRARRGESPDRIWSSFPPTLTVLGYNIGFTYIDEDGNMKEVKGSKSKYLGVTPNKKTLVVVGKNGVEYLMEGGMMRVEDWIYN